MSNDDPSIISKEGFLQVKLYGQPRWHRRYCIIDWDKAILFVASKYDRQYGDWIKLLPIIFIIDSELPSDFTIEIKVDSETHFLQAETKKEHDSWLIAIKRTAFSRVGGGIFGQSLEDTNKYSLDKTSNVPVIVRQCCDYILEHGTSFVGLFRIPGKQSSIRELRDIYDRGETIVLNSSYSPATISSLLKNYLQCLPEPLIPMKYFDEYLQLGSHFKYHQLHELDNLKQLLETTLSNVNYSLLAYLCLFLKKITEYSHETKMDSENLAIVFGINLIRPAEELDMTTLKEYNCNLIPLIKVLIDQSEYLFPINLNESCEQHNESIRKSSGFSSFSSLLSSNEHHIPIRPRSSSLPSSPFAISSSVDSATFSFPDQLDTNHIQYRTKSVIEKPFNSMSYQTNNHQTFLTSFQGEFPINAENDGNRTNEVQKRVLNNGEMNELSSIIKEQKRKSAFPWTSSSRNNASSTTIRRTTKKTFADKFGKSMTNFKVSMSKAFNPHLCSSENLLQSNTIDTSSYRRAQNQRGNRPNSESSVLTDHLKHLQNEVCVLKGIIDKKETIITNLTKTSDDERLRYEKENLELKQQIEQLQYENCQLKALYKPDN